MNTGAVLRNDREPDGETLPFVVVPMLNEVAGIAATCQSLGFAEGCEGSGTTLVLVDNGSNDGTVEAAESIQTLCGEDRVILVREGRRGYVPARASGVRAVVDRAARLRLSHHRILMLQADADTVYEPGYVDAMVGAANAAGRGMLLEGVSIPPLPDQDPCRLFRDLESQVDGDALTVPEELDVVVDDKVAGCFLSDYEAWGGHTREFRGESAGDELLAETTRLFIHARLRTGARRLRVEEAMATTTQRRILEDPALAFATAGFPREASWVRRWHDMYSGPALLEDFSTDNLVDLVTVIAMRRRHIDALFRFLPALVSATLEPLSAGRRSTSNARPVPFRKERERRVSPSAGRLLEDALRQAGIA